MATFQWFTCCTINHQVWKSISVRIVNQWWIKKSIWRRTSHFATDRQSGESVCVSKAFEKLEQLESRRKHAHFIHMYEYKTIKDDTKSNVETTPPYFKQQPNRYCTRNYYTNNTSYLILFPNIYKSSSFHKLLPGWKQLPNTTNGSASMTNLESISRNYNDTAYPTLINLLFCVLSCVETMAFAIAA